MGEVERPLLAEVYPALVSYLEASLISKDEPALSEAVQQLRFHGWCKCGHSCTYLQTAAPDSRENLWIDLDDEEPRVWLQLDGDHTSFAGMEILEFTLGPAPELDPLRPAHIS